MGELRRVARPGSARLNFLRPVAYIPRIQHLAPGTYHHLLPTFIKSTPSRNMAPSATNDDAIAVLEEIKAPPGVVLPPKEIKGMSHVHHHEHQLIFFTAILEKTAGYVARNGIIFEGIYTRHPCI